MTKLNRTRGLVLISLLSAIAFILMFLKVPVPFLPPYLTIDISDLPAIIALFTVGPVGAVLIEFIKNILNFVMNMTDPVGPVANFLAGTSFILTLYVITKGRFNKIIPAFISATIVMTIVMSILNYFVLLPMYGMIMNLNDVVKNIQVIVTAGIIPFNIIKGLLLTILFYIVVKPLVPLLKKQMKIND
ncbi:ECF transporter S component [Macrococcoides goetzii]|nr:ECF transporter S component [Macrococcus goetzii]TDM42487.1 ECF transporter S component [Macrococcus goetzii]TDM46538.1 ECF transporter S component [Macrococcus goetzii]TDM50088.1 ECF transporter S component [Macrococcus goetzii]